MRTNLVNSNDESNKNQSIFLKIMKGILFVIVSFIIIGLIFLIPYLLIFCIAILPFKVIIPIILFVGGFIWMIIKAISSYIVGLCNKISPNKNFSFWVSLIFVLINLIRVIYLSWTNKVEYTGALIFMSIVIDIMALSLAFWIILYTAEKKNK